MTAREALLLAPDCPPTDAEYLRWFTGPRMEALAGGLSDDGNLHVHVPVEPGQYVYSNDAAAGGLSVEKQLRDAPVSVDETLLTELASLRRAGDALAEAAHRVTTDYDGVHRLRLALAGWYTALANEFGRAALAPVGDAPASVEKQLRDKETLLAAIRRNALAWHGPLKGTGHERALAVIVDWIDNGLPAALASVGVRPDEPA